MNGADPDDPAVVLRQAREQFIAAFAGRYRQLTELAESAIGGDAAAAAALRGDIHRLTGLAGTIGFPRLSERSGELEERNDPREILAGLPALDEAFTLDLATGGWD